MKRLLMPVSISVALGVTMVGQALAYHCPALVKECQTTADIVASREGSDQAAVDRDGGVAARVVFGGDLRHRFLVAPAHGTVHRGDAIAAGAGRPTIIGMKNNILRGVRKASDFLMALQLTGAFKEEALANLQVELPALVIGGGLTAIDTATELAAYYPLQVEKTLKRYETLVAELVFARDHNGGLNCRMFTENGFNFP